MVVLVDPTSAMLIVEGWYLDPFLNRRASFRWQQFLVLEPTVDAKCKRIVHGLENLRFQIHRHQSKSGAMDFKDHDDRNHLDLSKYQYHVDK